MAIYVNNKESAVKHLQGKAMPGLIKRFNEKVAGKRIKSVGYIIEEESEYSEAMAIPCIELEDGNILTIMADDEGNEPGSVTFNDQSPKAKNEMIMLCDCHPK